MQANLGLQFDFRNPLQRLAQNPSLEFQLPLVGNVLVMASAALPEVRTARLDAIGRSFDQLRHRSACKPRLPMPDFGLDFFPGQHKRHKHRHTAPVRASRSAGQAVAAVNQFFDSDQQVKETHQLLSAISEFEVQLLIRFLVDFYPYSQWIA